MNCKTLCSCHKVNTRITKGFLWDGCKHRIYAIFISRRFSILSFSTYMKFCHFFSSTLSSTIHAIVTLLYPFSWQHTFIPVLPSDMIDVVCSPTPYIIGITTSLLPKTSELPIDEVSTIILILTKFLVQTGI